MTTFLADAGDLVGLAGGVVGLVIGLFVLVLAIWWLIFPFLVVSKFNELLKATRNQTRELEDILRQQMLAEKHLKAMLRYYETPPAPVEPERESLGGF